MKILKILRCRGRLAVCALLFITSPSWAATYYVDATLGDDARDGQSEANAWKTVTKVNAATFLAPGDSVLFKCGETWREQLVVSNSGTAGNPITFGSYGNCNGSNKPVIDGSVPIDNWTALTGGIYVAPAELFKTPINLVANEGFDTGWLSWSVWSNGTPPATATQQSECGLAGGCLVFNASTSAGSSNLVYTTAFPLEAGQTYQLDFWAAAAQPTSSAWVRVLRAGPTYENVGLNQNLALTTAWQSYSFSFTATTSLDKARLDFSMPAGSVLYLDNVVLKRVSPEYDTVKQVFVDGQYQNLAQHPNRGYMPERPSNVFLSIAQDQPGGVCPGTGGAGTNTFTAGTDLVLTAGQEQDLAGAGVHIRTNQWLLDDRAVSVYDAGTKTFTLSTASTYNLCKGWGYYLDNKLWMLDQPGEWYFDAGARQIYLMPEGGVPDGRVIAGHRDYAVFARSRSHVVIEGLSIRKAVTGIEFANATGFVVRNTDIADSAGRAISVEGSRDGVIDNCTIGNSVREAIWAENSRNTTITNNRISNTGVVGAPKKTVGAIEVGCWNCDTDTSNALIRDNVVQNSGYIGILLQKDSTALNNYVENSCLILDDCGAIYTSRNPNNSRITGNIVMNVWGNPDGRPAGVGSAAQGIYLDNFSDGVQATGNTVVNADHGFQLHIASNNTVSGNVVYGARRSPIWMQESKYGVAGTIHGNVFSGNQFFPLNTDVTYKLTSNYGTIDFASYNTNRYSLLYSDVVASESYYPGGTYVRNLYTFPQWVQAKSDIGSTAFDTFVISHYRILSVDSANLITNSAFESGISGWSRYSQYNDAELALESVCASGNCLRLTAGATSPSALTNSNAFSVQQGKKYRVKFDLRGGLDNQRVTVTARKAGPNYDAIGLNQEISVDAQWRTYVFVFESTATVPDATANGARLDLQINPTQTIYLDNVSFEEVTVASNDPADDAVPLVNPDAAPQAQSCADAGVDPSRCGEYVYFADASPVTWPVTVPAHGSVILVWAGNPFRDSDRDGVLDMEPDLCPGTTQTVGVNANGCAPTDLALTVTASAATVLAGDEFTYRLTVANNGDEGGGNVVVTDNLPNGVTWVSSTPDQGSCSGSQTVVCDFGFVPVAAAVTVSIRVKATVAGTYTNNASVSSAQTDTNTVDNNATSNSVTVLGSCSTSSGYKISGKVTRPDKTVVPGVTMTMIRTDNACGNRTATASDGTYSFTKLPNATYLVTPSGAGCSSFDPPSLEIVISGRNKNGQKFTGVCP